jgi:hypothetical protein
MEYYAPAKGAPSSFVGLEGGSGSDSTGGLAVTVLGSIAYEDWGIKHGAPSPGNPTADTGADGKLVMTLLFFFSRPPKALYNCSSSSFFTDRTVG